MTGYLFSDRQKPSADLPPQRPERAALLGDIVASRRHVDRAALQERLLAALSSANARVDADQPLTMTIGDEFQGLYASPARAIDSSLALRLMLVGEVDLRFGIGWGRLAVRDPDREPYGQDGPAWWAARAAIDRVAKAARAREGPKGWRTAFAQGVDPAPEGALPSEDLVNALLMCRDELVSRMDARDARLLLAWFEGRKQADIGADEGISPSAVSQRFARNGAYAIRHAHELIGTALG
jgi:SatD family (SatD)